MYIHAGCIPFPVRSLRQKKRRKERDSAVNRLTNLSSLVIRLSSTLDAQEDSRDQRFYLRSFITNSPFLSLTRLSISSRTSCFGLSNVCSLWIERKRNPANSLLHTDSLFLFAKMVHQLEWIHVENLCGFKAEEEESTNSWKERRECCCDLINADLHGHGTQTNECAITDWLLSLCVCTLWPLKAEPERHKRVFGCCCYCCSITFSPHSNGSFFSLPTALSFSLHERKEK